MLQQSIIFLLVLPTPSKRFCSEEDFCSAKKRSRWSDCTGLRLPLTAVDLIPPTYHGRFTKYVQRSEEISFPVILSKSRKTLTSVGEKGETKDAARLHEEN